jgi:two-component system OmpR family response regulator
MVGGKHCSRAFHLWKRVDVQGMADHAVVGSDVAHCAKVPVQFPLRLVNGVSYTQVATELVMRILLIEDDLPLAQAVCSYLCAKHLLVDTASDIVSARTALATTRYAAVLLDLQLGHDNGLTLLPALRVLPNPPALMVLTARDQVSDRILGLDLGADDYLVKPYDPGELLARLRAIERRRGTGENTVIELGGLTIDLGREMVRVDGMPVTLTAKEWAVLRVLATRPDRIHPRETLQDALYGFDRKSDSNTLEVFVNRLRSKLGRGYIQTLRGLGYRLAFASVAHSPMRSLDA